MKKKSYEEALGSLASLCAESEKCKYDVIQKAVKWGLTREEGEKIAEQLEKGNFINELRYANFYARDKYRLSKWGKKKIEYMLKGKGISEEYIAKALKSIPDEDYSEIIENLVKAKLKTLKYSSMQDARAKLFRFCQSKGYALSDVTKAVNKITKTIGSDEDED